MYISTYLTPVLGACLGERMIRAALWYQLRVVYGANDIWPYVWQFPFTEWYLFNPSQWTIDWQRWSQYVISEVFVRYGS